MVSPARKNGKSTLAAAIALFAASMDFNPVAGSFENVAQVLLAATKREQAARDERGEKHARIGEILADLDVAPAQVFIDVKFVTTSNNDLFELGVDYGDSGIGISASGGQIPITFPFDLGAGGLEDDLLDAILGRGAELIRQC